MYPATQVTQHCMADTYDLSSVLVGSNSPASLHVLPSPTSTPIPALPAAVASDIVCKTSQDNVLQESEILIVRFVLESPTEYRLRPNAPPPKLHFSTFWRSVSRRIYNKHKAGIIVEAQEQALKLKKSFDACKMCDSYK